MLFSLWCPQALEPLQFRISKISGSSSSRGGYRNHQDRRGGTLDLYAQAGMQEKRKAQSKLVDRVLRKGKALA